MGSCAEGLVVGEEERCVGRFVFVCAVVCGEYYRP